MRLLRMLVVIGCSQEKTPEAAVADLGYPGYECRHKDDDTTGREFFCQHPETTYPRSVPFFDCTKVNTTQRFSCRGY